MTYFDGLRPPLDPSAPQLQEKPDNEKRVAVIQKAFARGVFQPFESELKTPIVYFLRDTWLSQIQAFINQKPIDHSQHLTPCYLFAVALDPDLSEDEKNHIYNEFFRSLNQKEQEEFNDQLNYSLPAFLKTHILRYCSKEAWENSLQHIFRFPASNEFESSYFGLMLEVIQNRWTAGDKQAFFDKFFEVIPKEKGDELLYYFAIHASAEQLQALQPCCSESLSHRKNALLKEISDYGDRILRELETNPSSIRFPYLQNQPNKRIAFLEWFYVNARESHVADLVATGFEESDWQWLHEAKEAMKEETSLPTYAMRWMTTVAMRLSGNSEVRQPTDAASHGHRFQLFFSYATDYIEKNKGFGDISHESYKLLASSLSSERLIPYFDVLRGEFRNYLIKFLVENKPQVLMEWIRMLIERPDDVSRIASSIVSKLCALITKCSGERSLIDFLLHPNQPVPQALTLFASVSQEVQRACLKTLLADRQKGMSCLSDWIKICVDNRVRPFVRNNLLRDLYTSLNHFDVTFAGDLKNFVRPMFGHSSEGLDFLDSLLPVGVDLNDPIIRQKEAFKKLKRNFLVSDNQNDRSNFVNSIYFDLKSDLRRSAFVERLFLELPEATWPLLLIYFRSALCDGEYSENYEQNSGGGTFKKVKKDAPPLMEKAADENRWRVIAKQELQKHPQNRGIQNALDAMFYLKIGDLEKPFKVEAPEPAFPDAQTWINKAAQILNQIVDNPFIAREEIYIILRQLYQGACDTNTIYQIVARYIELAPCDKFIPTLGRFATYAFRYNRREDFASLVIEGFANLNIDDKASFIAERLCALHARSEPTEFASINFQLEKLLVQGPILKNDEERARLSSILQAGK